MYNHLLIPIDGSELSLRAVEHGVKLAKAIGAKVSFLTVTEPFLFSLDVDEISETRCDFERHMKKRAKQDLERAAELAASEGISYDKFHREHEQPYHAIIDTAHVKRCDLIVMASHGRRGVSAMLLGSETMKVLTHTRSPVLVVR